MRQSIKDKGLQMSLFTRDHLVFALQKHELGTKLQIIINLLFMVVPNFASSVSTHTHDSNNKLENYVDHGVGFKQLCTIYSYQLCLVVWFQTSYIEDFVTIWQNFTCVTVSVKYGVFISCTHSHLTFCVQLIPCNQCSVQCRVGDTGVTTNTNIDSVTPQNRVTLHCCCCLTHLTLNVVCCCGFMSPLFL